MKENVGSEIWIKDVQLSVGAKEQLAIILNKDVKTDEFKRCELALIAATKLQQIANHFDDTRASELKIQLLSLRKSYSRVLKTLNELSPDNESILDQYHYLANDRNSELLVPRPVLRDSNFYEMCERMAKTIDLNLEQLESGSKIKHTYSDAIANLKKDFEYIFPDRKPSREPESLFHQLIVFWFNELLRHPIQDASRHIDKVLNQP